MQKSLKTFNLSFRHGLLFAGVFGVIGVVAVLITHAAEPVTISGYAFEDANRNGALDTGEKPMVSKTIYFCNNITKTGCSVAVTDANGFYSKSDLSPSNYTVQLESPQWWEIYNDWTPTTTNKLSPYFTQDVSASVQLNFGFRQIYYSGDVSNYPSAPPVSTYTPPSGGPVIKVYNDAISAQTVYDRLAAGSLISQENKSTTIYYGAKNAVNLTGFSVTGSWDSCVDTNPPTNAGVSVNFKDSFGSGGGAGTVDSVLFHEYGHAWSQYWACLHGDPYFKEYLEVRGLTGDTRLNTSHAWSTLELIAEDYRQLFGNPTAASGAQENREIPAAKDVEGLRDYLSTTFMTPKGDTRPTAPSNLTAYTNVSSEGISAQLNWTASTDNTGIKSYLIYRDNQLINIVNSPSTTYHDSSLKFSTTYKYHVIAADNYNNYSVSSNIATVTTPSLVPPIPPDTSPPSAPSNLTVGTITKASIGLNWTASTDNIGVIGYQIYRIDGRKASPVLIATVPGTSTSFNSMGLKASVSYSFYIKAIDAAGNISDQSKTITAKTRSR